MNKNVSHLLLIGLALMAISLHPWTEALAKRPVQLQSFGPLHLPAPALIPGTLPEMNSAGFWIGKHPCPDKIILDAKGIQLLNMAVRTELKCSYDLSSYPAIYPGKDLISALSHDIGSISGLRLYNTAGLPVTKIFLSTIKDNLAIPTIQSEINVTFGFIIRNADLRALPVGEGLYQARVIRDFDRLQTSSLDLGTPLAILHSSADREWLYVVAPSGEGWVESRRVASCPFEALKTFLQKPDFVIITAVKGDLYLNREMTAYYERAKMGQRFPLIKDHGPLVEICIPDRNANGTARFMSAFIGKKDVSQGYLPYTPRTIIRQAFEFLNDPYGWGDMNGEQDCSSFLRSIFATVGIELPRNSFSQSQIGKPLSAFQRETPTDQKIEILKTQAIAGITLLKMKGHIMLYLGSEKDVPYAIHGLYGYHEKVNKKEILFVVNRIVVTDLNLGKNTRTGPFLARIDQVRAVE